MINSVECNEIFNQSIQDYHKLDHIDAKLKNPYKEGTLKSLLYEKNWIDTVQWHLEDLVRDPSIDPAEGMTIKRKIDKSNQWRTDTVEQIDDWFMAFFKDVKPGENARLNTESPAWVLDRMSILCLKIFHMEEEVQRADAGDEHRQKCSQKLQILKEQQGDLSRSFEELVKDIQNGEKYMKVYRQMKMYNDPSMNPVLYQQK